MDARTFRHLRGYSQSEMAAALDWGRRKYQRWEAGERVALTPDDRVKIARLELEMERTARKMEPA
jgi:transcriptional regulator with XRE-family HTH domain